MKSFKQFLEEASNAITRFGSSNHELKRKGVPHPDHLDMPHIYKWIYGIQKKAGKGGSPGQPYTPPKEDPKNPYVPAPKRITV
tara:strand:- start:2931 stop:3179 length:249 start_codon:yes stop_codon:yes gene_type:complete